jgi:uncharacterized membrane protein
VIGKRIFALMSSARSGLWFIPVMCVLAGVAVSFGTIAIDRHFDYALIPRSLTGEPEAALSILSTVAASMVSLTALVLTVTMVVVQLAMGQFSPRIVQTILKDKPSQIAIGLFVATFAHAMLAMREVSSADGQVPGVAIVVAFVLVLVSIAVLVMYVHHIGQSLRVASLIELVGHATRDLVDEHYPPGDEVAEAPTCGTIEAVTSGVVSHIDRDELVEQARRAECELVMIPAIGEFVPAGAPLFRVHGGAAALDPDGVTGAVVLTLERTLDQDVAYGFRLLVDIAERSLAESPFLDPTTAVQAIDRLHDCLRRLVNRSFPSGECRDVEGEVRLVVPTMDWDAYVHLAFDEIRLAGAGSPQVARRLRAALEDLASIAPPERMLVLRDQLDRLGSLIDLTASDERDANEASRPDRQGIGVRAGAQIT